MGPPAARRGVPITTFAKDGEDRHLRLPARSAPCHDARPRSTFREALPIVDRPVPPTRDVRHATHAHRLHPLFRRLHHRDNKLIGVIIADVKIGSADTAHTHALPVFQIRTFWIEICIWWSVAVLAVVVIGFLVFALVVHLGRWCVTSRACSALNDNKPIANPADRRCSADR